MGDDSSVWTLLVASLGERAGEGENWRRGSYRGEAGGGGRRDGLLSRQVPARGTKAGVGLRETREPCLGAKHTALQSCLKGGIESFIHSFIYQLFIEFY